MPNASRAKPEKYSNFTRHIKRRECDEEHVERCLVRLGVQLRLGNREAALRIIDEAFAPEQCTPEPITRDSPLIELELDKTLEGVLSARGVAYAGQLLAMTDAELLLIPPISPIWLARLDSQLARLGLVRDCKTVS